MAQASKRQQKDPNSVALDDPVTTQLRPTFMFAWRCVLYVRNDEDIHCVVFCMYVTTKAFIALCFVRMYVTTKVFMERIACNLNSIINCFCRVSDTSS